MKTLSKQQYKKFINIEKSINKILIQQNPSIKFNNNKSWNDLGFDSLDMCEIIMHIESEYYISIDDEEFEKFTTPNKLIDYLINKV